MRGTLRRRLCCCRAQGCFRAVAPPAGATTKSVEAALFEEFDSGGWVSRHKSRRPAGIMMVLRPQRHGVDMVRNASAHCGPRAWVKRKMRREGHEGQEGSEGAEGKGGKEAKEGSG